VPAKPLAVAGNSHLYLGGANIYTGALYRCGGYLVVETSIKAITNDAPVLLRLRRTKTLTGPSPETVRRGARKRTLILTANTNSQINVIPLELQIGMAGHRLAHRKRFQRGAVVFDRSTIHVRRSYPAARSPSGAGAYADCATPMRRDTVNRHVEGRATNAFSARADNGRHGATLDLGGFNQTVSSLSGGAQ